MIDRSITQRIPENQLSTLLRVSSALASSLDLGVVLQTAIKSAVEVLGLETGAIYRMEDRWLFLGATTPPLDPELDFLRDHPEALDEHPHLQKALTSKQPVYLVDAETAELSPAEKTIRDARHLKSILYIPLLLEDQAIGAMIVGTTRQVHKFAPYEIDLCRILSYQVTLAVANARLYKSIRQSHLELTRSYDDTLLGWSMILEMRDQDTQGHTQRVTQLTLDLARKMGLPEPELAHIRRGALLHDIGKMSIPDTILKKNGPLTENEWAIMRQHPELAQQFLSQISYLSPALDIPYCHHEKWDGSGYPRGLKGEEIPLAARIFAVADVYDALTARRYYRPAWEKEEALRYIREQSGVHFDPTVVKMFLGDSYRSNCSTPSSIDAR